MYGTFPFHVGICCECLHSSSPCFSCVLNRDGIYHSCQVVIKVRALIWESCSIVCFSSGDIRWLIPPSCSNRNEYILNSHGDGDSSNCETCIFSQVPKQPWHYEYHELHVWCIYYYIKWYEVIARVWLLGFMPLLHSWFVPEPRHLSSLGFRPSRRRCWVGSWIHWSQAELKGWG